MDFDSWSLIASSASRRYQSRPANEFQGEESDVEEDQRTEFSCPYCSEHFDMVGFCCHIDGEHVMESKNGVCPFCAKKVGSDLVGHMTAQHGNLLKVQQRRRLNRGGSNSSFSYFRRGLRERNMQPSSGLVSSAQVEPDPLLSAFMFNPPAAEESPGAQHSTPAESSMVAEGSDEDSKGSRAVRPPPLQEEELKERTQRCKFVQGLLLSTFVDDIDDDF